jgi:hypothetical protein
MDPSGHWAEWHEAYRDPTSSLSRRLVAVQMRLSEALDSAAPGPINLISMCAGRGLDVIGVLGTHPRRRDVRARLVELDPQLVLDARANAAAAQLDAVEVVEGDASMTGAYRDMAPAGVVLVCGVFGNITDADIRTTVASVRQLTAPGGAVIWTRHRRAPDLTPQIREWFRDEGFEDVAFDAEAGRSFGVGTNRLPASATSTPPSTDRQMFRFVGKGDATSLS